MATVRKRKWAHNGVEAEAWIVTYTDQAGKRRQKTFDTKKAADRYRLQAEIEIDSGIHVAASESVTIREATAALIKDCERRHAIGDQMSGYTLVAYRSSMKAIAARFGAILVRDFKSEHAQVWIDELSSVYKRRTLEARAVHLFLLLRFSTRRKWVKRNVLADEPVRMPNVPKHKPRIPDKADILKLLRAMDDPKSIAQYPRNHLSRRVFVALGIFAGLRRGEMAGLQWENIDFNANVIRIRHSLSHIDGLKLPKTFAGIRDVQMVPPVRASLLALYEYWTLRERVWRERGSLDDSKSTLTKRLGAAIKRGETVCEDDPPLSGYVLRAAGKEDFVGGGSIGVNNLSNMHWRQIMRAADLLGEDGKPRFTVHAMRHAAVSLLIEQGLPAMNLKTIIGHSSITTTLDVYGSLFPSDGRSEAAMNAVAASFDATRERQIPRISTFPG